MQHIELLGAPGSAKSTISRELLRSLPGAADLEEATLLAVRNSGHDGLARMAARMSRSSRNPVWRWAYARSPDRFSALQRFINAHPKVMQRVTKTQRRRSDRDLYQDMVLGWLMNLMARYQLAVENHGALETLVIDEGFCQRAVALFGYGFEPGDEPRLQEYLEAIPLPDVVIVVDTPLSVCEQRLNDRGWSERVAGLDETSRQGFLRASAAVVDLVVEFLGSTDTKLIHVDGTTPTADAALQLAAALDG